MCSIASHPCNDWLADSSLMIVRVTNLASVEAEEFMSKEEQNNTVFIPFVANP